EGRSLPTCFCHLLPVPLAEHASCWIVRRIQNDEPGASIDQMREFVHVKTKIFLFSQTNGNGSPADVTDHRLINRESGVGINDLIPFVNQRENREEDDGLAPGHNYNFFGSDCNASTATYFFGDRLAQIGQSS